MFCPKCGTKVLGGAVFCQKCGTKLVIDESTAQPVRMSDENSAQQRGNHPTAVPMKKKVKKLPIILGVVVVLFLILVILAAIGGSGDSGTSAVDVNGVNLSMSYENTDEGLSFQYPSAYALLDKEELANLSDDNESGSLIAVLANEIDDLPEANTYIMVSKFPATQDVIDHLFIDDEQFAATFDNDVTVKNTSTTTIDGVAAREVTYLTSDGIGCQSYFYTLSSTIYRIDFTWRGESSGNNQRFFDAIIDSYKITSPDTAAAANTAGKLLYKNIPVAAIMEMSAEDIIAAFGEPDVYEPDVYYDTDRIEYESDQVCFIMSEYGSVFCLDAPTEKFTLNGQSLKQNLESLTRLLGNDCESLGGAGYRWNIDGLSCTFYIPDDEDIADIIEVTKIDTDDPIDNDAYLSTDENYASLDSDLVGRWRSYTGKSITLNEYGYVTSSSWKLWDYLYETPTNVTWTAENGRIDFTAQFQFEYPPYEIATDSYGREILQIEGKGNYWREDTGTLSLEGVWQPGFALGLPLQFYSDGTGLEGETHPFTWFDGDALTLCPIQGCSYDYTVSGDTLTLFFSDGAEIFTRVGN